MKRITKDRQKSELVRLADVFARARGAALTDEGIAVEMMAALQEGRVNEILLHGHRAQAMFAYVAAALGNCILIKEEDAGEIMVANPDAFAVPDFRIITKDGTHLLIEVKNFFSKDPRQPYSIKKEYLEALQAYGAFFGLEVKTAIYWCVPRLWTLLSPKAFEVSGRGYSIKLPDAVMRNEMKTLGDHMIGTRAPLRVRFTTDPDKPRAVGTDGKAESTIKTFELWCGDTRIERTLEMQIAWFLIWYGHWSEEESPAEVVGGELVAFEFVFRPEVEKTTEQGFDLVGYLSEMISNQFNHLTAPSGTIVSLVPFREPGTLGVAIPQDYRGEALPLWRFHVTPNYE